MWVFCYATIGNTVHIPFTGAVYVHLTCFFFTLMEIKGVEEWPV